MHSKTCDHFNAISVRCGMQQCAWKRIYYVTREISFVCRQFNLVNMKLKPAAVNTLSTQKEMYKFNFALQPNPRYEINKEEHMQIYMKTITTKMHGSFYEIDDIMINTIQNITEKCVHDNRNS